MYSSKGKDMVLECYSGKSFKVSYHSVMYWQSFYRVWFSVSVGVGRTNLVSLWRHEAGWTDDDSMSNSSSDGRLTLCPDFIGSLLRVRTELPLNPTNFTGNLNQTDVGNVKQYSSGTAFRGRTDEPFSSGTGRYSPCVLVLSVLMTYLSDTERSKWE